jgi:hypothetical protein
VPGGEGGGIRALKHRAAPELGGLSHPIAVVPDVDDVAVVEKPVDESRGHDLVSEDLARILEACVRVEDGGGMQRSGGFASA